MTSSLFKTSQPGSTDTQVLACGETHRAGQLLSRQHNENVFLSFLNLEFCHHHSPGRQVDGGSLADIFVVRRVTRLLRLLGKRPGAR